jgi:hypothetical protein
LGAPVVPVYVRFVVVVPLQTDGFGPRAMVGADVTITAMGLPALEHPPAEFVTVSVPLYVAAAAPAGTVRTIGVAGRAALVTFANPAASAAAL